MWYVGANDGNWMDLRSVLGPFPSAADAEQSAPLVRACGKPDKPAKRGDFFVVEVGRNGAPSCLLGPHPTREAARDEIIEELTHGGTFITHDSQFVGVVRYHRQARADAPQLLILKRLLEPPPRIPLHPMYTGW